MSIEVLVTSREGEGYYINHHKTSNISHSLNCGQMSFLKKHIYFLNHFPLDSCDIFGLCNICIIKIKHTDDVFFKIFLMNAVVVKRNQQMGWDLY